MNNVLFTVGLIIVVLLLRKGDAAPNIHCRNGQGHDPCNALKCLNGGTCTTDPQGIARCICLEGFFGQDCKIDCRTPGYTYFSRVKRCFKFYDDVTERDAAQLRCEAENASLVVLDSKEKELIVTNYTLDKDIKFLWIGLIWLSGIDKDSKWKWVDGQLLQNTYQNWFPSEPETLDANTTCACFHRMLVSGGPDDIHWDVIDCTSQYTSICEKQ